MAIKHWVLFLFIGFLWGSTYFLVGILVRYFPPEQLACLRVCFAALILSLYCVIIRHKFSTDINLWGRLFVMGALNNTLPTYLINYGMLSVSGGVSSILSASAAFFGVALSVIFDSSEKIKLRRVLGTVIGMVGVVIVVGYQYLFQLASTNNGQLLILLAALIYAFAAVWGRLKLRNVDVLTVSTGMLIGAG